MKKIIVMFVIIIAFVNSVYSQEIKSNNFSISDITISSGKGALTSGFDTRIDFTTNDNNVLFIQANNDRACVNIGKKFGAFKILESVAVYKNIPWTGPMVLFAKGAFDAIVWNGVGFAKTKDCLAPDFKPQFFVSYEGLGATFARNNRIGGAVMYFESNPKVNWFISYKRTVILGSKAKVFAEVTYNHQLDIPMFIVGYSLKFK